MTYKWEKREPNALFSLMRKLEGKLQEDYDKYKGESFTFLLIQRDLATVYHIISTLYSQKA
jgi:hypothetical protein